MPTASPRPEPPDYCVVGVTPDWPLIHVVDRDGQPVDGVTAVDIGKGWMLVYDDSGALTRRNFPPGAYRVVWSEDA